MANPKRRHSKSRRDKRRGHWKLKKPVHVICPQCQQPKLPHRTCLKCGFYNSEQVITVIDKSSKKKAEKKK